MSDIDKAEIIGDASVAKTLLKLMQEWDANLQAKESDKLVERYSQQVRVFDVGAQYAKPSDYQAFWQMCLPYLGDNLQVERRHIRVNASQEMGLITCLSRLKSEVSPKDDENPWMRTSICFQNIDDQWQVVNEHISMPIDFEQNAPNLLLGEPEI